uniref:Cellulose synthase n=1 Tax=Haemonchus placei TaxID=6290 RepID=A0A0N4VSR3_HAEPC
LNGFVFEGFENMLKLARGSSNFSVSSIEYDCPPRPKREAQKRKGVRFDDELHVVDVESNTMSTSTFLRQQGLAWNSLARAFGCEEELGKDDATVMNELLNLCNFWSETEPIFRGPNDESDDEDDSDDDLESFEHHIAMLASSSNPKFSATCSSSSSGVSSLRLNSLLRLSNQSCRSSVNSSETLSCLSKSPFSFMTSPVPKESIRTQIRPSTSEALEKAFKGIVDDDNEVSQDSVLSSKASSDDFWSQVEF